MKTFIRSLVVGSVLATAIFAGNTNAAPNEAIRFNNPTSTDIGAGVTNVTINLTDAQFYNAAGVAQNPVVAGDFNGNSITATEIYFLDGSENFDGQNISAITATPTANAPTITLSAALPTGYSYYVSFATEDGNFGVFQLNVGDVTNDTNTVNARGVVLPYIELILSDTGATIGTGGVLRQTVTNSSETGTTVWVRTNARNGYQLWVASTPFGDGATPAYNFTTTGAFQVDNAANTDEFFGVYVREFSDTTAANNGTLGAGLGTQPGGAATVLTPAAAFNGIGGITNATIGVPGDVNTNAYTLIGQANGTAGTGGFLVDYLVQTSPVTPAGAYSADVTFRATGNF